MATPKYTQCINALKRQRDKHKSEGLKNRTFLLHDTEYEALKKYQKDNNFKSINDAVVSLIPEDYLKKRLKIL